MKNIKYFRNYKLMEAEEINDISEEKSDELSLDRFKDLNDELTEMIKKSIGSESNKVLNDFIEDYNRSPEDNVIEGLINDSDIYDFYLKWRTDVDDILSAVNFFDDVPSEMKVYSLYEYIIEGTKKAVKEIISLMEKSSSSY